MRTFLLGALLGAVAGILYAPFAGSRTRSLLKDKLTQLSNDTSDLLETTGRDISDRMIGVRDRVNMAVEEARPTFNRAVDQVKGTMNQVRTEVEDLKPKVNKAVDNMKDAYNQVRSDVSSAYSQAKIDADELKSSIKGKVDNYKDKSQGTRGVESSGTDDIQRSA